MSDIMRPIPFSQLMNWIIEEHKTQDAIFGVRKMVTPNQEGALPIFDERIETPFGPAAGPNTQLAQNIVASYVAGSRFFELKTVQVMDGEELSKCVNKPCIVAQDECYNCEWSTELEVPQAFAEYVKAWFACHLIAREYGLGSPDGFVFNMSVHGRSPTWTSLSMSTPRLSSPSRHASPTPSPSLPCTAARRPRSSASRPI